MYDLDVIKKCLIIGKVIEQIRNEESIDLVINLTDDEILKLALNLILEFDTPRYSYVNDFQEFVDIRLDEMQYYIDIGLIKHGS